MDKTYYDTVDRLEKAGVDRDYILGWIGGYMSSPKREEQRITEAYEAGYEDGLGKQTEKSENFKS
ncbi:MAG: hypothetical protein OES09_07015 [Gammaproteobacteria bacterium]|nr:hypothetical protein [Gammaproteobacteria bacterium]